MTGGYKQSRRAMVESYERYDRESRNHRSEPRQWPKSRLNTGDEYRNYVRKSLGCYEPRMEWVIGTVD